MMEILAEIFLTLLLIGIAVTGMYAAWQTDKIKAKWERDGVHEYELRARFDKAMGRDD